jgi:hypothetical protein
MNNEKSMFDGNRINIIRQESPFRLFKSIDVFKRQSKETFEDRIRNYIVDNVSLNISVKNISKNSVDNLNKKKDEERNKLIQECISALNMVYSDESQKGGVTKTENSDATPTVEAMKMSKSDLDLFQSNTAAFKLFINRDTFESNTYMPRDYLYTYFINLLLKDYGNKRTLIVIPNLINNDSNDSFRSLTQSIQSIVKRFKKSDEMKNVEIFSLNIIADTRTESYDRKIKDEFARLKDHVIKDYTKYKLRVEIETKRGTTTNLDVLDDYIHNVIFFTVEDFQNIDLDTTATKTTPHKYYNDSLIPEEFKKFTDLSKIGYQNVSKTSNTGFQSQNVNTFKRAVSYFKSGLGDNKILTSSENYSKYLTSYHIEAFYELLLHIYRTYTDPKYAQINGNDDAMQIIYRFDYDEDDEKKPEDKLDIVFNQSKSYVLIPDNYLGDKHSFTEANTHNFRGYFVSKEKDRYIFKVSKKISKDNEISENIAHDLQFKIRVQKKDDDMYYESISINKKTKMQTTNHHGILRRLEDNRYYEYFTPNRIDTKLSSKTIIHYDYELLIDNDLLNKYKKDVLKSKDNDSNSKLLLEILSDTNIDQLDKLRTYVLSDSSLYEKYMLSNLIQSVPENKKLKYIQDFAQKVRSTLLDIILQNGTPFYITSRNEQSSGKYNNLSNIMKYNINEDLSKKLTSIKNTNNYVDYVNRHSNPQHFHQSDTDRKKFTKEAFIDLKRKIHDKPNRHLFVVDLVLSKDFKSLSNKTDKIMECESVKKRIKQKYSKLTKKALKRFNKSIKYAKRKVKNSYNKYILGKTKKSIV